MSAPTMIMIVGVSISSMAFIFIFMLLRKIEINEERILIILGEHAEEIKNAKDDEELKKVAENMGIKIFIEDEREK